MNGTDDAEEILPQGGLRAAGDEGGAGGGGDEGDAGGGGDAGGRRRSRTMSRKEMARQMRRERARGGDPELEALIGEAEKMRPHTRAECINAERPCTWVACKYNLYLDVNPQTGSIKLNFPDLENLGAGAHLRPGCGGEGWDHPRGGRGDHEPHPRAESGRWRCAGSRRFGRPATPRTRDPGPGRLTGGGPSR